MGRLHGGRENSGRAPALGLFSCFIKVGAHGRGGRGGRGGYGGWCFTREADAVPDDAKVFRCTALRRRSFDAVRVRWGAVRRLYFRPMPEDFVVVDAPPP